MPPVPFDDEQTRPEARSMGVQPPPDLHAPPSPHGEDRLDGCLERLGLSLLLMLLGVAILLIGVLPAADLIYSGYFTPNTPSCGGDPFVNGVCYEHDFKGESGGGQYTYAQAVVYGTIRQWIERVIGIVWALLTLRFVFTAVRGSPQNQARAPSEAGTNRATRSRSAYRREHVLSLLTVVGIAMCLVGLLFLFFVLSVV